MRKFVKLLVLALGASLLFSSCAKKESEEGRKPSENIDSSNWIDNLLDGKAAAQKENKRIFLFFSADDQDESSKELKDSLFNTPEFIEYAVSEYVLVNLDFSNSLFEQTQVSEDASQEEKDAAEALYAKLQENLNDATMYNVEGSPCFFILTKEGYVVTEIIFEDKPASLDDFKSMLDSKKEEIEHYYEILDAASTGSKADRIKNIDELFSITGAQHRYLLVDFSKYIVENDKKNESGSVGAHVVAIANANAVKAYLDDDAEAASNEFVAAAENEFLTAEEKQQCYYTAGYLFAQSGSMDFAKIKGYFQKAYDAAPDSENASLILQMVNMFDEDYYTGSDSEETPSESGEVSETETDSASDSE